MGSESKKTNQEVKPKRILLIDDEDILVSSLGELLTIEGYDVDTSTDGSLALEMIKQSEVPYDLIITDIVMTPVRGIDILEFSRSKDPDTVVILMTGFVSIESTLEAIRMGAYDYLVKPFEIQDFLLTVERGLERRKLVLLNRSLIDNLSQKNTELENMIDRLKKYQSALVDATRINAINETVIAVRHEIMNPLTGIATKLQLLLEKEYIQKNEKLKKALIALKNLTDRIDMTMKKLDNVEKPVSKEYIKGITMLDIKASSELSDQTDE